MAFENYDAARAKSILDELKGLAPSQCTLFGHYKFFKTIDAAEFFVTDDTAGYGINPENGELIREKPVELIKKPKAVFSSTDAALWAEFGWIYVTIEWFDNLFLVMPKMTPALCLSPLDKAEALVLEKTPGSPEKREEFLKKLREYKNQFKIELEKKLAKGNKADPKKIRDAQEIAYEYYKMTKVLCDPDKSHADQKAAIKTAYDLSTQNFWWNFFFELKFLKIALITAAAALVGFAIGYLIGNAVGGVILGYKFATAAASAHTAAVLGAGTLAKVGSSIGIFGFFYTPLERKSKALRDAAEGIMKDAFDLDLELRPGEIMGLQ